MTLIGSYYERIQEENVGAFIFDHRTDGIDTAFFAAQFDSGYFDDGEFKLSQCFREEDLPILLKVVELARKRVQELNRTLVVK